MDSSLRIVTSLPLATLWNDAGELPAVRDMSLGRAALKDLLRTSLVQFIVADVGRALKWVDTDTRFEFWKHLAEPHLVEPDADVWLDRFPGGLAYRASLWRRDSESPIVLLEAVH